MPWNDTHFFNEKFDKLLVEARAELDQDKCKNHYREMAIIVRDEGGVIAPMFAQEIDAISDTVGGYVSGRRSGLMDGFAFNNAGSRLICAFEWVRVAVCVLGTADDPGTERLSPRATVAGCAILGAGRLRVDVSCPP